MDQSHSRENSVCRFAGVAALLGILASLDNSFYRETRQGTPALFGGTTQGLAFKLLLARPAVTRLSCFSTYTV